MDRIGKLLRKARTEKSITIDDISRKTKIQKKYLRALEEGDLSIFSGEIYIKGALKNYAQYAGLNIEEILSLYDQFKKQNSPEKKEQQLKKSEQNFFFTRRKRKPFPGVAIIWIILLAFVFIGSFWYFHEQKRQKDKKNAYPGNYLLEDTEQRANHATPGNMPKDKPTVEKELVMVSESNNEVTYAISGVERAEITLSFHGRCWVRIMQDGTKVEEKIFDAGESKNLEDARETSLHFGNPPAARISVNGLAIDNLVQFTSPVKIIIKKSET